MKRPRQDSVNIFKTFPTETLGEQSSKGLRCQETKGVEGASARQKTPTKTFKDPSRVVNTPKGGEDRYNYEELMETLGNINLDVLKQGAEIKELKLVILSQQVQMSKLKKMVLRLVHKKKRKQYVLKKRGDVNDAFKKGENQVEKQSPVEMNIQFEGEIGAKTKKEVETDQVSDIAKAAVTNEPEAETELSREEIEIAKTLVKAKNDTPKATQKAKRVMIKEGGLEKKIKEVSVEDEKKKGKEKMIESEQPLKKKKQIELDEEVAKKLQEELEKEEEIQSAKDRELALDMDKKINEEYQRSLKPAVVKKVTNKATVQRQRKPSKTFLANQERRKMINFLNGALGVPEGMFTNMHYGRIEELYKKEMANLKGDSTQRVEVERKMKERHDLNIQQPFPDSEEGTPSKDKEEVKQEETLTQKIGDIKRKKSIATKPKAKRTRTEEAEKERERKEDEPPSEQEQNQDRPSQQTQEQTSQSKVDLYMTVTYNEPMKVDPISVNAPEIIYWDMMIDQRKEYFRIKRMGDKYEVYSTWAKIIRSYSISDLEEMYKVGMNLYCEVLKGTEMSLLRITMEYLCMMFDPERVKQRIKDLHHEYGFKRIDY
ncbi:hypothetical protein L6452_20484 [Arctium lappa]|uniref:Uncharacterized protein n=1 Tax=Arctium lappa TaxID=4217 RepID=A0ACB9BAZ2_ARCLA|nr:hypothetical protein L6452_20484 [Arctium lappa]